MTIADLIRYLLRGRNDVSLEVCIDASIPIPILEVYDIVFDKGFLLFRKK